ncbi:hypothetical protein [Mesorhizobium sp.]|uniref:hypothetical protein n=1 Tax=Mesorhizobium sp. TaxID=1871066 RepID=UPI000FE3D9AD|nr:hypothetical protein [Mesorhizobium sp.]RWG85036.1 MAG: hypothetical protein EOQ70_18205 [Mesorhizobium sp.]RWK09339.1 MAG: hypothetical protein EOR39_17630 [Mesorhizobium sp.]RWK16766.1 MAG: hypothetical protein EOR41_18745 [Mesorhizobium sp.]TIQ47587.1 MAG: hypothetical protein E5X47_21280 [Mesorhizobium sp.]TIQ53470.1 MAG: hypothetical protein E5X46_30890 [Mesorhizobium sp.]
MKFTPTAILPTITVVLFAGCSSTTASINPAKYDKMSCAELNSAVGDTATEISQIAIGRGKVANTSVPGWLLGGERVKTVVANRDTAKIERLQQQQQAIITARKSRCPSSQ